MFKFNDNRGKDTQVILTNKQMKEIENRQKLALMYKAKEKIEDYQNEVFEIIDNKGLKNGDDKTSLETALKVLPYIIPQKKAMDIQITTKSIEQIIQETIPEAEIIEEASVAPGSNDNIKSNED